MSTEKIFRRAPTVLHRRVGVDVLVTTIGDRSIHRLSGPAGTAWLMLESPMSVTQLASDLASFYGVDAQTTMRDVGGLVHDLAGRGWLAAVDPDA